MKFGGKLGDDDSPSFVSKLDETHSNGAKDPVILIQRSLNRTVNYVKGFIVVVVKVP